MSFSKQNFFAAGGFNSNPNQLYSLPNFNVPNIIQNFGFNDANTSQLQSLLTNCSYHPQHSYSVYEAVTKLLNVHPQLKPDILTFKDGHTVKSLIELQGILQINFHGDRMGVSISIMFPEKYPQHPPHLRIINTHPEQTEVTPHYVVFESKNYPDSYVISTLLSTIQNWNHNSNIIDVIREAEAMMGKKFPFKKIKPGHKSNTSGIKHKSSHNSNQGFNNQSNNQGFNNSEFNNNNQGFSGSGYSGGNQGWNNQGSGGGDSSWDWNSYNNSKNNSNNNSGNVWNDINPSGWNTGSSNNNFNNNNFNNNKNPPNFNNYNNPTNNYNNNFPNNTPPKPPKLSQQQQAAKDKLDDYITRSMNFAADSKKMVDKLLTEQSKDFKLIQTLQPITLNVKNQKQTLQARTKLMMKFIKQNEAIEEINLKKLFSPLNEESSQLLELVSISKAANDTLDEIQRLFGNGGISLEQLLKLTRKIEEERFMSKVMIKKKLESKV